MPAAGVPRFLRAGANVVYADPVKTCRERGGQSRRARTVAPMPGFIGFPELIVLVIVLLLIFGPKRLPEIGRSLGRGLHEFKDSVSGKPEPAELPDRDHNPTI